MPAIHIKNEPEYEDKVREMQADARFDVADESGRDALMPGLSAARGIHGRSALPKVPKAFLSNSCSFNCAYCGCRTTNDIRRRYCYEPRELAALSVSEAVRCRRGIFLTSAIFRNADYTQELIIETLRHIRGELQFNGYVHAKVMPGADTALIEKTGLYADRLSVNIEVAKNEGFERVAKQKNRENILRPMGDISNLIKSRKNGRGRFAVSQSTQLMAGSVGETDRVIMTLSDAMYRKYNLSRVYYTSFHYDEPVKGYDIPPTATPSWRMKRLYQADRLLKLYGFSPEELTPESRPNLTEELDPKAAWALSNPEMFPLEAGRADFMELIRVPGIGIIYAKRIIEARKYTSITHDVLEKIGVPLNKSRFFITCSGKYAPGFRMTDFSSLYSLLAKDNAALSGQLSISF